MTPLSVEIIETRELTDGHVAFLARCNGDPSSDSWHTYAIDPSLSDAELDAAIEAEITAHQTRVARLHQARKRAVNKVAAHKGKTKNITL